MRPRGLSWLILSLWLGGLPSMAWSWVHPGILNNAAEFALMRQKVSAGEQPWSAAYAAIPSYLTHISNPPAEMVIEQCDGCQSDANTLLYDGLACYGSALHWMINGKQTHANKAIQILNDWAVTLKSVRGNQADLTISWYAPWMLNCAEIIKHTASGWSATDQTAFRNMVIARFKPWVNNITCPNSNSANACHNWGAAGAYHALSLGVFLEDQPLYDYGMNGARKIIDWYIGKFGNTGVFEGFTYETCRNLNSPNGGLNGGDLSHAMMALAWLAGSAEISKKQGTLDLFGWVGGMPGTLFGADGNGIRQGMIGHAPWYYFQRPTSSTPTRPGANIDTWPCTMTYPGYNGGYGTPTGSTPIRYRKESWNLFYNHYRVPLFQTLAVYRGDAVGTDRDIFAPWDRLTHNYVDGGLPGGGGTPATPQTWYVATTGTGTACTQAAPCSIAEAMNKHLGSDTIKLGNGVYPFECSGCLKSGTSGQPTILEAMNYGSAIPVGTDGISVTPGLATLSGNTGITLWIKRGQQFITVRGVNCTTTGAGTNPCLQVSDPDATSSTAATDLLFENMDIQAPTRVGTTAAASQRGTNGTARVTWDRVRIHHAGAPVTFGQTNPTSSGLRITGPDHRILNSDFFSNERHGIFARCEGCTTVRVDRLQITGSRFLGNGMHGIDLGEGTDQLIAHNIMTGNGGTSVRVNGTSSRVKVFNNSIYGNNQIVSVPSYGLYVGVGATGVVRNNIVADHLLGPIFIGSTASQVSCSHSLTDLSAGSGGCTTWTFNALPGNIWVDPTHATLASRDFRLLTAPVASPAINNGTTDICTSADTTANRCNAVLTVSGAGGSLPDQGAIESGFSVPVNQALIASYAFDTTTNMTDSTTFANHGTATSVTIDTANARAGDGAALFNATTDRVTAPLTGLSLANGFSIALSARTVTLGTLAYVYGHTRIPPSYSDRIQLKKNPADRLVIGLGGSASTLVTNFTFAANTYYRIVLTVTPGATAGAGTFTVWVDGVQVGTGTYTGLTQLGTGGTIGNNDGEQIEGWNGQIDEVRIWNYPIPASLISADCTTFCVEPIPPDENFELGAGQIGPSGDHVVSIEVIAGADPAKCTPLSDWQVTYDGVAQTETGCSITGTTPSIARITLAAPALPGQVVILTYQALDPITIQNQVQGTGTFDPLVLLSCTTDVTGLDVTCQAQGNPNPNECQGFAAKFVVRDECIPVTLSNCSMTTGPGGRFVTLRRVSPPVNGAIAIDLIHVPPDRRLGVTNLFDPTDPEIPPTTDLAQTQWRCRVDGLDDSTPWRGRANTLCRAPSPGGVNLRVAVANTSAAAVPEFATSLFCARQDLDTCSGGTGTCPIGGGGTCTGTCVLGNYGEFTRVGSTFGTLGLRYGPQTAHGVPNGVLLPTRALPIDAPLTYAAVGGFRREELQTGRPTLDMNRQMEDEFAIHTGPTAAAVPIGTRFVCRAHGPVGNALASYTGVSGCTNDPGPFGPGDIPCGAPLLITAPERRSR